MSNKDEMIVEKVIEVLNNTDITFKHTLVGQVASASIEKLEHGGLSIQVHMRDDGITGLTVNGYLLWLSGNTRTRVTEAFMSVVSRINRKASDDKKDKVLRELDKVLGG